MKKVLKVFFAFAVMFILMAALNTEKVSADTGYYDDPEQQWGIVSPYLGSESAFSGLPRAYKMKYPSLTWNTTHDEFIAMVQAMNRERDGIASTLPSSGGVVNPVQTAREISNLFETGYQSNDVFGNMREYVKSSGFSFLKLVQAIALVVMLISLMFAALKLGKKDPREREESKRKINFILIVSGIIFSLVTIVTFVEWLTSKSINLIH